MSTDERLIRDLQQSWMEAWQHQDAGTLESILADDFVFTLSTDPTKPYSRAEWLRSALGSYTCESFAYENMAVRLLEGYAVVCSHLRLKASISEADRSRRFWLTDIWRREAGTWKVIARYTYELQSFRTLRGFLKGEEPDEENYFNFSATLRIHGQGVPFEEISERLGVSPTHLHRKGERYGPRSSGFLDDAWQFQPSLPETEPLERHIEALWQVVRPEFEYLKSLKERFEVDVFCGYRSNCDIAGFEVSHKCLEMFTALEVPFGVSVIIA